MALNPCFCSRIYAEIQHGEKWKLYKHLATEAQRAECQSKYCDIHAHSCQGCSRLVLCEAK